jgi:predicted Rossmann fold flavoprotein
MKTIIVGAGASGLLTAIILKKKDPKREIDIIDKEIIPGRKLLATGNGHCNLLNKDISGDYYNHPEYMNAILKKYPYSTLKKFYEDLGLGLLEEEHYVYPLSYSASCFTEFLLKKLDSLRVKLMMGVRLLDYLSTREGITINTSNGKLSCDELIFCSGGESTPKLGSDGSIFSILNKHGYHIVTPLAGLTPVRVKEKQFTKPLFGLRHQAKISLFEAQQFCHEEEGEILFKEDGLSGICIFNLESVIARRRKNAPYYFSIDLFPHRDNLEKELAFALKQNPSFYLDGFLLPPLSKEVIRQAKEKKITVAESLHKLTYRFDSSYPFSNSQVTVGGVDLSEVDNTLTSLKEKGVRFVGEILDIDGFCGGFNLSWALLSALIIGEKI